MTSPAPPLPRHLQLEVTAACNLRCTMCLVSYRPPVNKADGAMAYDVFTRLVDSVPDLERLTLQGLGEPLLSPYLLDMVAYAKQRGIAVGFNSNGMLLTRRVADRLVGLGLDWLHVSIDGARAETFAAIRAGAELERVGANLRGLYDAKRAAGAELPWTRVVFVAMRRNIAELPELVRLLASWGVDELRVQNLSHSFDDTDPGGSYAAIREFAEAEALWSGDRAAVEAAFEETRRVGTETGVAVRLPTLDAVARTPDDGPGCSWPWDAAYVTSSGVVQPCCMVMGDDRVAVGDVRDRDFADVWHGEEYRRFREGLLGGEPPQVCRGCSMYHGTF
ncbi:MAG: radical SAM protein [Actinomycetota bacterium]|nr:radical SAM protein [Actinomycetota bacterium]